MGIVLLFPGADAPPGFVPGDDGHVDARKQQVGDHIENANSILTIQDAADLPEAHLTIAEAAVFAHGGMDSVWELRALARRYEMGTGPERPAGILRDRPAAALHPVPDPPPDDGAA